MSGERDHCAIGVEVGRPGVAVGAEDAEAPQPTRRQTAARAKTARITIETPEAVSMKVAAVTAAGGQEPDMTDVRPSGVYHRAGSQGALGTHARTAALAAGAVPIMGRGQGKARTCWHADRRDCAERG